MPREGYTAITLNNAVIEEIDKFNIESNPELNSRPKIIEKAIKLMDNPQRSLKAPLFLVLPYTPSLQLAKNQRSEKRQQAFSRENDGVE